MSLQPLRPVDRRSSWRARLPLWDRETFQSIQVGKVGEAGNATIALALFRECEDVAHWHLWRDYGWPHPWRHRPVLSVATDDGTGFLTLESADPAQAVILNVPPYQVGAIHPGRYRTSLVAVYADGTVLDLGGDLVTFQGQALQTAFNGPMMAGGPQPAGLDVPINGVVVPIAPVLPAPLRQPYA